MNMFCFQCQETAKNSGCTVGGVCGKDAEVATLQDILLYKVKGLSHVVQLAKAKGLDCSNADIIMLDTVFATITNANFDPARFDEYILLIKAEIKVLTDKLGVAMSDLPKHAQADISNRADALKLKDVASVKVVADEDLRSLREIVIYGIKGASAYLHHALMLGKKDEGAIEWIHATLAKLIDERLGQDKLLELVLECGNTCVSALKTLHDANTGAYGAQEITQVYRGTKAGKGILVSGHDLKDIEELLIQTEGTGINIYTHGEMLPSHSYPKLKKYKHLVGNFGGAWWRQRDEFDNFPGAILFTTNCIQRPKDSYKGRMFTTGSSGWPGSVHIADRKIGGTKDFSPVIEAAKRADSLVDKQDGEYTIGFGAEQVLGLADQVVAAVKSGAIKKFVVMAGCDGRHKEREYFTDVAKQLPNDAVILTAGCAKYRYNDLDLGNIGGIPRVLDAGQCNDSYSLAVIALKLKEVFELDDINKLPISFDIGWYEQKAVAVLLALIALGFKNLRLGPTLPAFISPNVAQVLIDNFNIMGIDSVENDVKAIMA